MFCLEDRSESMVEGPKVVLKVQRIQSLKGQTLEAITLVSTSTSVPSLPLTAPMQKCIGMTVRSVWCLGKELFLTMAPSVETDSTVNNIGIRLHFGMAGSERLIATDTLQIGYHFQSLSAVAKSMLPKQSRKKWNACLIFGRQSLFIYDTTITTKTSNYLDKAFLNLECDVMSFEKFCVEDVVKKIRLSDQSRHIHEVIMVRNLAAFSSQAC